MIKDVTSEFLEAWQKCVSIRIGCNFVKLQPWKSGVSDLNYDVSSKSYVVGKCPFQEQSLENHDWKCVFPLPIFSLDSSVCWLKTVDGGF